MKVKDLIKELLELNAEAEVSFQISDGCCGDYEELGPPDLDQVDWGKTSESGYPLAHINFRFPALDIMSSCIASGIAKRAVDLHREPKSDFYKANSADRHKKYLESKKK